MKVAINIAMIPAHAIEPTVIVAGLDPVSDGDDFAEQGPTLLSRDQQALDFTPKLRIVLEDQGFGSVIFRSFGRRWERAFILKSFRT